MSLIKPIIMESGNYYVWNLQLLIGLVREGRIAYSIFTHLVFHGSAYFEVSRLIALVASCSWPCFPFLLKVTRDSYHDSNNQTIHVQKALENFFQAICPKRGPPIQKMNLLGAHVQWSSLEVLKGAKFNSVNCIRNQKLFTES